MIKAAKKQLVLKRKEDGASLIEYAVIAALVVGIAVIALGAVGDGLGLAFGDIIAQIRTAATPAE
jgi:Flp pilus assembly pilin Flp